MSIPVPKSRRGKIIRNLKEQLKTITVDNGYTFTVQDVSTNVKVWSDLPAPQTPVIFVVDDSTRYNYHAGKTTEREWFIDLFIVMRDRTQEELEEFISDVEECLMKNVTLYHADTGQVASHIRIESIVTDNQLFSEIEGSQLAKITINVRYIACVDKIR